MRITNSPQAVGLVYEYNSGQVCDFQIRGMVPDDFWTDTHFLGSSMYERFSDDQMTMRDLLARDRTILANERTLLAYLRTVLGLLAGGVTLIKLFGDDLGLFWMGLASIGCGVLVFIVGVIRFFVFARRYRKIRLNN